MPAPSAMPLWDSSNSNLAAPSAGQITSGWTVDQVPPSNWFNWWMNLACQWIIYLAGYVANLLSTANEWTAAQDFDAGVAVEGGLTADTLILSSGMSLARASITANPVSPYYNPVAWTQGNIFGLQGSISHGTNIIPPAQPPIGYVMIVADEAGTAGGSPDALGDFDDLSGILILPAWAPSTSYAFPGQTVTNGGHTYQLIQAGTSASSGGPTGTGSSARNIVDGTCLWNFCPPTNNIAGQSIGSNNGFLRFYYVGLLSGVDTWQAF